MNSLRQPSKNAVSLWGALGGAVETLWLDCGIAAGVGAVRLEEIGVICDLFFNLQSRNCVFGLAFLPHQDVMRSSAESEWSSLSPYNVQTSDQLAVDP